MTDRKPSSLLTLKVRSTEQLSALKSLRVLGRFTIGRLAATAGVRAATLRPLFLRWERQGFRLLNEVGAERSLTAGQPPKLYVLNPELQQTVDAAIAAADPGWRAQDLWIAGPTSKRSPGRQVERLNFFDAAQKLIADAEQATGDSEARAELIAEADRLLERSRAILQRREATGRGGASADLQRGLERAQQQIVRLKGPDETKAAEMEETASPAMYHDRLRFAIEERVAELRQRAVLYDQARKLLQTDNVEYQKVTKESCAWLSASARHYLQTRPPGRDAEVGFFGGFLVVRGELSSTQNTLLDEWLSAVAFAQRGGDATDLQWNALQDKFVVAFGRIVDCGHGAEAWHPVLTSILEGIRKNARLAVVRDMQKTVASLVGRTPFHTLRQAGYDFLQQYSTNSGLLRNAALSASTPLLPLGTERCFQTQAELSALFPYGNERDQAEEQWKQVDLAAHFRMALAPRMSARAA